MCMDNYAYLVSDTKNDKHVLIDPGHAEPVQVGLVFLYILLLSHPYPLGGI